MIKSIYFRFLLFLGIVILFDVVFGLFLRNLFFEQKRGTNYRTTFVLEKTKKDIIILGSSRASHHYVPEIFSDSLSMSCYNGGRDGTLFDYSYACTQALLTRYKPKMILIDINLEDFYVNTRANENLQSLLPYYRNHPEIRTIIQTVRGPLEKYKQFSFCYPFNSTLLNSFSNIIRSENPQDTSGYMPLEGTISEKEIPQVFDFGSSNKNELRIDFLKLTAQLCQKNQIKLVVVQSPRFGVYKNHEILNEIRDILTKEKATFISYDNANLFSNPQLYKDASHLNDSGARVFSGILVSTILNQAGKK